MTWDLTASLIAFLALNSAFLAWLLLRSKNDLLRIQMEATENETKIRRIAGEHSLPRPKPLVSNELDTLSQRIVDGIERVNKFVVRARLTDGTKVDVLTRDGSIRSGDPVFTAHFTEKKLGELGPTTVGGVLLGDVYWHWDTGDPPIVGFDPKLCSSTIDIELGEDDKSLEACASKFWIGVRSMSESRTTIETHPTADQRDDWLALSADLQRAVDRARRLGMHRLEVRALEGLFEKARKGWLGAMKVNVDAEDMD